MTVEFVRSCYSGYWRFDASRPGIITPGYFFFVPDDNPHLSDFHFFGSADWQKGDDPEIVGDDPSPFKLGNDLSLGRSYYDGFHDATLPPPGFIGQLSAFQESQDIGQRDFKLQGGIDVRCFNPTMPCYVHNLLFLGTDNCAFALVCMQLLKLLNEDEKPIIRAFLTRLLGPGTTFDFWDGTPEHPPFCIVQTPRNNLVLIYGTHTWRLFLAQFYALADRPQNFGDIGTLEIWWNHAGKIIQIANLVGVDYTKPTYLVGHSLGAATAYVLWHRLYSADRTRIIRVLAAGSPKPGDSRLEAAIRLFCIHTSYVSVGDIIPCWPPSREAGLRLSQVMPAMVAFSFGGWVPLHRYTFMQPGGIWEDGGFREPTTAQYVEFISTDIFQGGGRIGRQHEPAAYIRRMAMHCPIPEPPFDADCYDLLFDTDRFSNGGPWLAGTGKIPGNPAAGVVLGGLGDLAEGAKAGVVLGGLGDLAEGKAGIVLGGLGDLAEGKAGVVLGGLGDLAEGAKAGVVLGGLGDLAEGKTGIVLGGSGHIDIVPGSSCSTSGIMSIGDTYNGTHGGFGTEQWFKCAVTNGNEVHVTISGSNTLTNADVGHGTTCPPTNIGTINTSITPCIAYTPGADENVYIRVPGVFSGSTAYTISVLSGPC